MLKSWVEIALIMQILPLFCAVLHSKHDHEQLDIFTDLIAKNKCLKIQLGPYKLIKSNSNLQI